LGSFDASQYSGNGGTRDLEGHRDFTQGTMAFLVELENPSFCGSVQPAQTTPFPSFRFNPSPSG
jgi:hypothetical protein